MASSEKGLVIGPRVPRGLAPAVEGLTREILRHRPQDIYTFAAHHFEQLIELRETGRASMNRKCRVLVDWIGSNNKCQPVSDGGPNHDRYRFSVRKVHDSIGETREAIKDTTGTLNVTSTKLLMRRRRRRRAGEAVETANRNGWSINETVKAFKKHAYENNANKEKSRNTEKSKRSIEKEIHSYFEQRSPPLSKTVEHCRFHRSWSVEDMHLAKNSSRRFKENQVEPKCGSIELTSRLENGARTCNKSSYSVENTENMRRLKRQKSAGQIEDVCSLSHVPSRINRERVEYIVAPRRTHSLFNVTSNGSCGKVFNGKEETENISNEIIQGRQARRESLRGKGIEGKEKKKSEEGVTTEVDNTREIVAAKLNDSKGIDTVDNTNVITEEPRFILQDTSDLASKQDSMDNQESVILPSVVTKPCPNSRHSENVAERSENDTNYLILPPIPDASKPIKREDNLVLPVLSKLSEVIELDQQPLKSSRQDRVASVENGKEQMDAAVSESQTLQVNDYDCRMAVDGTTEKEKGSEVNVEIGGNGSLKENGSNETSDSIEPPPTPVKSLESGNENEKEKDEEQENEIENGNLDDEQEREQRTCPVGGNDELKSKLIEIEMVERSIENTLTSSETVLIAEDDRESVASRPVDCTSHLESESEKSSILFGNNVEAACIAGEMSEEKAACNTAEGSLCNCTSENDETDTVPREESNASTVESSSVEEDGGTMRVDVDDGEQSERARHGSAFGDQVSISCSKDVDLSCYVLTEGSPCEIPESVTTVIIPDKSIELQQSDDEIFRFGPETIEQDTNPFGEYIVYPAETCEYSTENRHVDFLRDITDAVDRTLAYKDLGNIKEEAEEEEEDKHNSEKDAMLHEKVVETCMVDEEISDQLVQVKNLPSETTVYADQGREMLEDCTSEQPLFSDTVTEPCVPELNLDSFRDATLSSVEDGSESNVENLSEKENDDGVLCEPETTPTSFDTMSPKTKATIDENPLSENGPNPDHPQGENATSSNDCGIDRKDSCNLEEEIARELIEHLTGDASTLEETDQNNGEGADSLDNATSERATVSTATVEPVDINIDSNTRDDSEVKEKEDSAASTYRSVCTIDETTFEQFSENRNQSELSREPVIDSNLRNKSLDAAVRIIQFRVREFIRRRRKSKKSDEEENHRQDSPDSIVREARSLPQENIQLENPGDLGTQGSTISHGSRHTGEFHDSLPLPLPFPFPVRESGISKVRISPMNATVHAVERIRDDAIKPSLTPKPDTSSFHYESPETCVLLAFDLPKSLQLIENASNWSTSCVNMQSYVVRVERDFVGDKTNADSLAGERSDSDVDDIREPLALDRTSNGIVIEEILTDDEEEKERPRASRSDDAVDESASSTNFTFEHIDFDSETRETRPPEKLE